MTEHRLFPLYVVATSPKLGHVLFIRSLVRLARASSKEKILRSKFADLAILPR